MQALIAPTETGYNLNDIKRAALSYDKIFILDQDDRDLFPRAAIGMAMGMPPIVSMPFSGAIRPMGKTTTYDLDFNSLLEVCKPLIDAGVLEVTSSWDRKETDEKSLVIGKVPLGGYELNVQAVLYFYRSLARDNEMLLAAIDASASKFAGGGCGVALSEKGQADGTFNDDPALPTLQGELLHEELRENLTIIARSRIATAIKVWGVAQQRGLVPVLPEPCAQVLDRLGQSLRLAIDAVDDDPYWSRRTAILDIVIGENVPRGKLEKISLPEILRFRTKEMVKIASGRTKLFNDLREMADHPTNLDLDGFKERIRDRLSIYRSQLSDLRAERSAIGWDMVLEIGKGALAGSAGVVAAGGLFHVAFPVSLTAALLGSAAWGIGKIQENLPTLQRIISAEKAMKESNEFAVFRAFDKLDNLR